MNHRKALTLLPSNETSVTLETSAHELNQSLATLYDLLKQLVEQAEEKLAGMRGADVEALHTCTQQETQLLEEVCHTERERNAILARLAQTLQAPQLKSAPLSEIVNHIPEPLCSALRARNVALHDIATKLQRKNRLAAQVAHNLQSHISAVFTELAKTNQESIVYGPKGQHEQANIRTCLDAVG
jgi:flagellar biosynthesis/type III secretory pathway chaperone